MGIEEDAIRARIARGYAGPEGQRLQSEAPEAIADLEALLAERSGVRETVTMIVRFLRDRALATSGAHAALARWADADYIEHAWLGVPWESIAPSPRELSLLSVHSERVAVLAAERAQLATMLRDAVSGRSTEHDAGVRYAATLIESART